MYISCLVTIVKALLSLGSDGHVYVVPRHYYLKKKLPYLSTPIPDSSRHTSISCHAPLDMLIQRKHEDGPFTATVWWFHSSTSHSPLSTVNLKNCMYFLYYNEWRNS